MTTETLGIFRMRDGGLQVEETKIGQSMQAVKEPPTLTIVIWSGCFINAKKYASAGQLENVGMREKHGFDRMAGYPFIGLRYQPQKKDFSADLRFCRICGL